MAIVNTVYNLELKERLDMDTLESYILKLYAKKIHKGKRGEIFEAYNLYDFQQNQIPLNDSIVIDTSTTNAKLPVEEKTNPKRIRLVITSYEEGFEIIKRFTSSEGVINWEDVMKWLMYESEKRPPLLSLVLNYDLPEGALCAIMDYINNKEGFDNESRKVIDYISAFQRVSWEFCEKYKKNLNWTEFCRIRILSEEFIKKFEKFIDFKAICERNELSEELIEKHKFEVNWLEILKWQRLSPSFLAKHYKHLKRNGAFSIEYCDTPVSKIKYYEKKLKPLSLEEMRELERLYNNRDIDKINADERLISQY